MRGSHLKLAFLVTLLLIAPSYLMRGIEARVEPTEQKPVQCQRPSDCVSRCRGCTVNQCTAGLCVCGCAVAARVAPTEQKPVQCQRPSDCVSRCHGCTVNQCTAGLCVCGCATAARKVPDTVF